jgi:dolichyl-phosphate-mannose--protein O-mannosyl transferase
LELENTQRKFVDAKWLPWLLAAAVALGMLLGVKYEQYAATHNLSASERSK